MWARRRVSGGSRPSKKSLTAQKWAKIEVFDQKSAGRAGDSFRHVVSACKTSTIMFCDSKNFYTMLRRPPAINGLLKNGPFHQNKPKLLKNPKFYIEYNVLQMCSKYIIFFFNSKEAKYKIKHHCYILDAFLCKLFNSHLTCK